MHGEVSELVASFSSGLCCARSVLHKYLPSLSSVFSVTGFLLCLSAASAGHTQLCSQYVGHFLTS